jgi:hypothetical protein
MNIEAHYLKYDSRHLSRTRIHLYVCVYIHACALGRRSASVCLSFLFFFFSISIDAIAQNEEKRERESEKGNSMMMSILWHRAHREKESSKISIEEGQGERTYITIFFSFLLFYSVSLSLLSANCMYKQ